MKKKILIPIITVSIVLVLVFLASCMHFTDTMDGQLLGSYVLRSGDDYYLLYSKGNTELTAGSKKNHTVTFGKYSATDTSVIDSFLSDVSAAREECKTVHPEYEAYDSKDEKTGDTTHYLPDNGKIDEFMNGKISFAESEFCDYNETRSQYTDVAGWAVDACEVSGTDGKILYIPDSGCRDVRFYVLASEVNSDLQNKPWTEFYNECIDKIYPSRLTFAFPWNV